MAAPRYQGRPVYFSDVIVRRDSPAMVFDDLRGAAVFLASRASEFVTGQTLFVDGGFSAG